MKSTVVRTKNSIPIVPMHQVEILRLVEKKEPSQANWIFKLTSLDGLMALFFLRDVIISLPGMRLCMRVRA